VLDTCRAHKRQHPISDSGGESDKENFQTCSTCVVKRSCKEHNSAVILLHTVADSCKLVRGGYELVADCNHVIGQGNLNMYQIILFCNTIHFFHDTFTASTTLTTTCRSTTAS